MAKILERDLPEFHRLLFGGQFAIRGDYRDGGGHARTHRGNGSPKATANDTRTGRVPCGTGEVLFAEEEIAMSRTSGARKSTTLVADAIEFEAVRDGFPICITEMIRCSRRSGRGMPTVLCPLGLAGSSLSIRRSRLCCRLPCCGRDDGVRRSFGRIVDACLGEMALIARSRADIAHDCNRNAYLLSALCRSYGDC